MCVQLNAVARKATPYMVLYYLTPARFRRYSSLNLCPPFPASGEKVTGDVRASIVSFDGGIRLVNKPVRKMQGPPIPIHRQLTTVFTGNWFFPRSRHCSN